MSSQRSRLTIDVPAGLRRRIKLAATAREQSVKDYLVGILETAVPAEESRAASGRPVTAGMIESLRRARDEVMRGRRFSVDSVDLLNEAREERLREL